MNADRRIAQLIELGRDREAVLLAASVGSDHRGPRPPAEGDAKTMDVLHQLEELGPLLMEVVGSTSADDLRRPTPCAAFDVEGILEHMVDGATAFAAAFRGAEPGGPVAAADGSDVRAQFGPALQELAGAIASPGALDRTVAAPFGAVPGETFARFVVLDGLVHGWDIAVATGRSYRPSEALVTEVERFAHGALAELRDGTTFADPVAAHSGATPIERLAAFTGRRVPAPA